MQDLQADYRNGIYTLNKKAFDGSISGSLGVDTLMADALVADYQDVKRSNARFTRINAEASLVERVAPYVVYYGAIAGAFTAVILVAIKAYQYLGGTVISFFA